jgi:hypothetical protein
MRYRLGLGLTAVAVAAGLGLGSYALAQVNESESPCANHHPCAIVNDLSSAAETNLRLADDVLAEAGQPISDCPKAETIYQDAGVAVDAVLGPCPTTEEAQDDVNTLGDSTFEANYSAAIAELGGQR